ncbi:uncharacterized protein N7458_003984 [Penicillium daleae]|uniref:CHAT domain-containing protein n=1 Tax=Penicillium daleae TaxID=63821 RepID=A0AAD6CBY3_9EURO|nr:uncharacterized protein N7458_003984 [Penicillium daleae]KAJ5455720.1 hypothetical protein N7458_003984 [Penicillium daleae]
MSEPLQFSSLQAPDGGRCSLVAELDQLPWTHPEHFATASKCGIFFRERYELTGKLHDIARAVYYGRYVVAHKDGTLPKIQLMLSLNKRFTHDHNEIFLHESMSLFNDVTDAGNLSELLSHAGDANLVTCLAQTQKLRYFYMGSSKKAPVDLDSRLFADREHHMAMPFDVRLRRAKDINPGVDVNSPDAKRADRLWRWSQRHKVEDEEDFQSALGYLMEAEKLVDIYCPSFCHIYHSIVGLLRESYLSTLRLERLDKAIAYTQKATEAKVASPTQRAIYLSDLGLHCMLRYNRQARLQDLETALSAHREAVRLYPTRDSSKAVLLDQLSNALHSYYLRTRNSAKYHDPAIKYLEEAVLYGQQSVDIERRSFNLVNLAQKFDQLFDATGDIEEEYIKKAADLVSAAAKLKDLSPDEQGPVLKTLGRIVARKYHKSPSHVLLQRDRDSSDIEFALQTLLMCAESPAIQPLERIRAAREAGAILYDLRRYEDAWDCLREAVGNIPSASAVHFDPEGQQYIISQLSGLGSEACSAGLTAGAPPLKALYVLEQARGILTTNLRGGSGELDDLKCKAPNLYEEFRNFQQQVMRPSEQQVQLVDPLDLSQKPWTDPRMSAIEELDRVVKSIRETVPGFRNFLTKLEPHHITELSDEDYITVLNTSIFRTDAIVLKRGRVGVIPLYCLEPMSISGRRLQMAEHTFKPLLKSIHNQSIEPHVRNHDLTRMLELAWVFIVEPICSGLGLKEHIPTPDCPFAPRVLWIPTGIFAQIPLHAAGNYSSGILTDSATARITSSYIASFRMLQHVRSRSRGIQTAGNNGVVLSTASKSWASLPKGIRKYFLPSADVEAAGVTDAARFIQWAQMPRAVKAQLLDVLPSCNYLHVNSHAETDVADPSRSHLILLDEAATESEPVIARLSVKEISSAVADKSILAFLAACSTAYGSVPELLDEGLQIGNAFQLAGFPHVIASLWPVYDFVCPTLAREFYQFLNDHTDEHGGIGNDAISWALHHAVSTLKEEYLDEPLIWAPFIHLGPMSKEVDWVKWGMDEFCKKILSSKAVGGGAARAGDAARGDAARGDAARGDAANGDAANGDAANGDAANGDAADGDAADGDAADGDAADGDAADGDDARARAVAAGSGAAGAGAVRAGVARVIAWPRALVLHLLHWLVNASRGINRAEVPGGRQVTD